MRTFLKDCRWGRFRLLRGDMISTYVDFNMVCFPDGVLPVSGLPQVKSFDQVLRGEVPLVQTLS